MDGCHKIIMPMEKSHKIAKLANATKKKGKEKMKTTIKPLTLVAGYWTRFGHESLSKIFVQKEERLLFDG